jgi:quercetin dioxygenase-like cupin family protein
MPSPKVYRWDAIPAQELAPGIRRRYVTTGRMTVAHFNLARGAVVPRHSHDHEQLSYVVSGALKFNVGGDEMVVRAGEAIQIPSWAEHGVEAIEDCLVIDTFAPVRQDWIDGTDTYFTGPR